MKTNGNDKALEAYKIFPYVAWGLTIVFVLFVYNIVLELKEVTQNLQEQTYQLQMKVEMPVNEIVDFEN